MQVNVIAIGKKMPGWVDEGVKTYLRRLPREFRFNITEIAQSRDSDADKRKRVEGEQILGKLNQGKLKRGKGDSQELVIALDVPGMPWSTEQLAQNMQQWQLQSKTVWLVIGGPDGLSAECLDRAALSWSLSSLTLPHPLVRVILLEQLYRAHTILTNHPYHRA